jgi:hypothetical protein
MVTSRPSRTSTARPLCLRPSICHLNFVYPGEKRETNTMLFSYAKRILSTHCQSISYTVLGKVWGCRTSMIRGLVLSQGGRGFKLLKSRVIRHIPITKAFF